MKIYYINVSCKRGKSITIAKSHDWDEANRWVDLLCQLDIYDFVWIADEVRNIK